jgi:hypothetical protein
MSYHFHFMAFCDGLGRFQKMTVGWQYPMTQQRYVMTQQQ